MNSFDSFWGFCAHLTATPVPTLQYIREKIQKDFKDCRDFVPRLSHTTIGYNPLFCCYCDSWWVKHHWGRWQCPVTLQIVLLSDNVWNLSKHSHLNGFSKRWLFMRWASVTERHQSCKMTVCLKRKICWFFWMAGRGPILYADESFCAICVLSERSQNISS